MPLPIHRIQIGNHNERKNPRTAAALEREIDELGCGWYGLMEEEIEIIEK